MWDFWGIFFRLQYLEWPLGEEGDGLSTIWGAPVFIGHPWPRPAHDRCPLQGCTHTAHTATTRTGRSKVRDNPLLLKHCRVQVCNDGVTLCVCGVCVYRCVCSWIFMPLCRFRSFKVKKTFVLAVRANQNEREEEQEVCLLAPPPFLCTVLLICSFSNVLC